MRKLYKIVLVMSILIMILTICNNHSVIAKVKIDELDTTMRVKIKSNEIRNWWRRSSF